LTGKKAKPLSKSIRATKAQATQKREKKRRRKDKKKEMKMWGSRELGTRHYQMDVYVKMPL